MAARRPRFGCDLQPFKKLCKPMIPADAAHAEQDEGNAKAFHVSLVVLLGQSSDCDARLHPYASPIDRWPSQVQNALADQHKADDCQAHRIPPRSLPIVSVWPSRAECGSPKEVIGGSRLLAETRLNLCALRGMTEHRLERPEGLRRVRMPREVTIAGREHDLVGWESVALVLPPSEAEVLVVLRDWNLDEAARIASVCRGRSLNRLRRTSSTKALA